MGVRRGKQSLGTDLKVRYAGRTQALEAWISKMPVTSLEVPPAEFLGG